MSRHSTLKIFEHLEKKVTAQENIFKNSLSQIKTFKEQYIEHNAEENDFDISSIKSTDFKISIKESILIRTLISILNNMKPV